MTSARPLIPVLVVDDDRYVTGSLRDFVEAADDMFCVGTCHDGAEAVAFVDTHEVGVIVMDIQMPVMDGVEAARAILRNHPDLHILMWTSFEYDDAVTEAMSFGATGFVLKSAGAPAVLDSIRAVSWGMTVIAPDPLKNWKAASGKPPPRETPDLSERERGVLSGLGRGLSNAEIARDLIVSESTVKADLAVLMEKFDAHNRVKLVLRAAEHGLLSG